MSTVDGHRAAPRRADVERNERRIVDAARTVFARDGLGASMASVAREAGVGKATLFRHFATPQPLIDAVFADRMEAYAAATRRALASSEPWEAFVVYVWEIAEMQASDRGFADLTTMSLPMSADLAGLREESYRGFLEIISRAKSVGRLRDDYVSEDLVVLLLANAGVLAVVGAAEQRSWRRLVGHLLRSVAVPVEADGEEMTLPPAPSSAELYRAMSRADARDGGPDRGAR